ncbi:MAG: hypothetical protein LHV69_06940 [Elusimicrobia bacterium]|nr:hypothetical protein [Candidatus Obscuribacterium magneticum]
MSSSNPYQQQIVMGRIIRIIIVVGILILLYTIAPPPIKALLNSIWTYLVNKYS